VLGRRLLATVAAAATGCALLAGCTRDPKPLPPKEATPRQVLDAYLLALQAGDCGTTHEFAVDGFLTDGDLCGRVNVLSYRNDGYRSPPSPDEVVLADTLTVRGGDQSLSDGDHLWFYTLRQQPDGAWRISAAGSGA